MGLGRSETTERSLVPIPPHNKIACIFPPYKMIATGTEFYRVFKTLCADSLIFTTFLLEFVPETFFSALNLL
jgi:hypothetical protein